jgi:hypothetical protein
VSGSERNYWASLPQLAPVWQRQSAGRIAASAGIKYCEQRQPDTERGMQVAVIGAGAVGCYYGGLKGVEHRNVVREADINARFPRLLKTILGYPE